MTPLPFLVAAVLAAQTSKAKPIPKPLLGLLKAIHQDFLRRKGGTPFFSKYSEQCLDGQMIIYSPGDDEGSGPDKPQPQQPSQMEISILPLSLKGRFKYDNELDKFNVCKFPRYGFKVNGHLVDWGPDREKAHSLYLRIVLEECTKLSAKGRRASH